LRLALEQMNFTILRFDTLDSTNNEAANQARQGADEGLCVIARRQTAGRGRQGRNWVSAEDAGLYFSIVLRPKIETRLLPLVTLIAGVTVHDTLKEHGLKPDIKWVNDVLVEEKKISGILAETAETAAGTAVILGIGINLTSRSFPDDIAETATSIEAETGAAITPDEIAETLTGYLGYFYEMLSEPDKILEHWRNRSSYYSGKNVRVSVPGGVIEGLTDGLEDNGALRIKQSNGTLTIVQAGDVERLRTS
jgi:BirA family transcriptional regulator, biotin operon repressor / biotin---[acetyl-CoA-carboxylase] ligase